MQLQKPVPKKKIKQNQPTYFWHGIDICERKRWAESGFVAIKKILFYDSCLLICYIEKLDQQPK